MNSKGYFLWEVMVFFTCAGMQQEPAEEYRSKCTEYGSALIDKVDEAMNTLIAKSVQMSQEEYRNEWVMLEAYKRDIGQELFVNCRLDEIEEEKKYEVKLAYHKKKIYLSEKIWRSFIEKQKKSRDPSIHIENEQDIYQVSFYFAAALYTELTQKRKEEQEKYAMDQFKSALRKK